MVEDKLSLSFVSQDDEEEMAEPEKDVDLGDEEGEDWDENIE